MHLAAVRLCNLGPYGDLSLGFGAPPRRVTVVFGGDGMGKTTLLSAIASTRPGHALPPMPGRRADSASFAVTEWLLGDDDPSRPHTLTVASPNAKLDEDEPQALMRRREQGHFDRLAHERGGFVLCAFSGARWFSRTPCLLGQPERTVAHWDLRGAQSFDDATRADLTRETKQILSYAAISAALDPALGALRASLKDVCGALLEPFGFAWEGASAETLEPVFLRDGTRVSFEDLSKGARHLIAIGTLTVRALYSAYDSEILPRDREGVALVDDLELQQDAAFQRRLLPLLRSALPRVQWIVTTASPAIASGCEPHELVALRRMPSSQAVEVHEGPLAVIH